MKTEKIFDGAMFAAAIVNVAAAIGSVVLGPILCAVIAFEALKFVLNL